MPLLQDRETKLKLIDQMSGMTPAQLSAAYWGFGYQFSMNSGCPPESNPQLARRAIQRVADLKPDETVLDVGSGRQYFLSSLSAFMDLKKFPNRLISLDIAPIQGHNLSSRPLVHHIQADASRLPFASNEMGLVVSNMALDYVEDRDAVDAEIFRILAPGRSALLTLMRPSMFSSDPESFIDKLETIRELQDFLITKYLIDNNVLTNSADQVRRRFIKQGFEVIDLVHRVTRNEDPATASPNANSWWEVELKKPDA